MTDVVIASTARTPLCKPWRGSLNLAHGATLGGHVVRAALERAQVQPMEVEDVLMGCALPEGATGWNIARQIALRAGLPDLRPRHDGQSVLLLGIADYRARRATHSRRRRRRCHERARSGTQRPAAAGVVATMCIGGGMGAAALFEVA